ncbi:hypothetical protein RND81_05G051500 [Saponaria officinalis]|uniref:RING-type domain-containing protein n=1 Tax=Saponaria officinalis TaxID=3572 RepID=A0AAW1KTE2_SAPOF
MMNTGLDRTTIDSLPSGTIRNKVLEENPGPECPICLMEYSIDDVVRHLPCIHAFHVHCIDQWLDSHVECLLCKKNTNHLLLPSQ